MSPKASTSNLGPIRTGQRQVSSCAYCYKRKIKCSARLTADFPCTNCVQRKIGDSCHQMPMIVRGNLVGGTGKEDIDGQAPLVAENQALRKQIEQQEIRLNALQELLANNTSSSPSAASPSNASLRPPDPAIAAAVFLSQHISHKSDPLMAPGSSRLNADVLRTSDSEVLGLPDQKLSMLTESGPHNSRTHVDSPGLPLLDLIPIAASTHLVEAHFKFVGHIHCVVHKPSFLAEHAEWLEQLKRGEKGQPRYDFLARYFAIISSALFFLDETLGVELRYSAHELATLPRIWFNAAVEALQRSDYMCAPTLMSLQAICILPMIGHKFNESLYIESLLHCARGLCQTLKIHLLASETPESAKSGLINRELGRRIWACLRVAECLGPAAHQPFALVYQPTITADPLNVDDEELFDDRSCISRPLEDLTHTSHLLAMSRLATLFRSFNDHLYRSCSNIDEQWELACSTDSELVRLLDICPDLKVQNLPYPTRISLFGEFDVKPWLQHVWGTVIPPFRIWIYRSFYGLAFSEPKFAPVRQIYLEAARDMIRERLRPTPSLYRKSWHTTAYTSLAGTVVATEFLHGGNSSVINAQLRGEVLEIIGLLERERGYENAMSDRGIQLLHRMIAEAPSVAPSVSDVDVKPLETALSEEPSQDWSATLALDELWPAGGFNNVDADDGMWWNGTSVAGLSGLGTGANVDWLSGAYPDLFGSDNTWGFDGAI